MPNGLSSGFDPVDHDPFARTGLSSGFEPVDHDPFATDQDALASTMTHQVPGPNPARPAIDSVLRALQTGLGFAQGGLSGAGAPMPDWSKSNWARTLQGVLQNPDNAAALGIGIPWPAADAAKFSSMVKRGTSLLELQQEFPDRSAVALHQRLSNLGIRLTDSDQYVNQRAWWSDPEKHDRAMELLDQRAGRRQAAKELGISEAGWRRWLDTLDVRESPGITETTWDNPENVEKLKTWLREGYSQERIADRFKLHPSAIYAKIQRLQEAGELQDYVPQAGYGLTAAGRTPTLPALRSLQQPPGAPPLSWDDIMRMRSQGDPGATKALRDYMKSRGLSALTPSSLFG